MTSRVHFAASVIDISLLAAFLSPFLPSLLKLGKESSQNFLETLPKSVPGAFGEAAWTKAQAIWQPLRPKIESKPAAQIVPEADGANN